jgi:hypothetical protein
MADGGLLLIFRSMSTEDLLLARDKLIKQFLALGPYSSQTVGAKSWTKDRNGIQDQLEAITFVLNERGAAGGLGYAPYIVTDFSNNPLPAGQPAGTTDQLSY